ncbi:TRAP transporter substrate-binding protein DctP [Natranaerofaba carboxydovora]|uniref:TRAP transporter substrate-binding protein DctP n=1 Tax=Natranaerofaba carboxydovora TaxID=2742683 RepID=UPI001F13AA4B|nr:TRAP transporter substrate-binding protein DctP [Natranaerofaba carboxydovora]UMZ72626.1 Lactate-binding periplasmic protein [Natranaerofaba carboxydovora]
MRRFITAKKLLALGLCLILVFSLLGCADVEKDEENAEENDEAATAEADPDEVHEWTIQTSWPTGILLHEMAEKWAERVEIASGGRIEIEVLPSGAMVGAMEVLDATHEGTIDGMHSWSGYWLGDHDAAPLFSSIPMLFETQSHVLWMYDRGLEYQNEIYQDEMGYNVKAFLGGATHPEIGAHSNVPLEELEDWQGTNYRVPGWMAEILTDMGVSVVTLEGDEVYPSLERGVVDAAEFSSPVVNHELGFQEVTDYYTGPGIHQPSCLFEIVLNKDSYEALSDDLKEIVDQATYAVTMESWTEDVVGGQEVLDTWEEEYDNEPVEVSEEAQLEFRKEAWDFIEEEVDGAAQEVWDDARDFYIEFNNYDEFMNPSREIPEEWEVED